MSDNTKPAMGADELLPNSPEKADSLTAEQKEIIRELTAKIQHEQIFRIIYRLSWLGLFYIAIVPVWAKYAAKVLSPTLRWIFMGLLLIILFLPSGIILVREFCQICTAKTQPIRFDFRQIADAENIFETVRKKRLEERFFWIFSLLIILNFYTLPQMKIWSAPIIIGVLDLLFIMICGTALGVDHIYTIITRLVEKWNGSVVKSDTTPPRGSFNILLLGTRGKRPTAGGGRP